MKRRILATLVSAVLPGAGQIYNHHWLKGLGFLGGAMILSAMARRQMMGSSVSPLQWLPSPADILVAHAILFGLTVWSAVDAYREGK